MRLIVLDKHFEVLGVISVIRSLIWTRRYYAAGSFELHAAAEQFDLLDRGRYLYRNDRSSLGVIREVSYSRDTKGTRSVSCKGYFAEELLNDRVIESQQRFRGTPETIGRAVVAKYIIDPDDPARKLERVELGEPAGMGWNTAVSITGASIGDKLYDIEKTQEMSHRLRYDYPSNKLIFEVWQGKDRTDRQTENSWAIFSESFRNVRSTDYRRDESSAKNYAYVAGEGEGADRVVVSVDIRPDVQEERRELYVDARDLTRQYTDSDGTEHSYTEGEYRELLRQRGLEKLAGYSRQESLESDVDPAANLAYGVDYDLGDLCVFRYADIGMECTQRITEIREVIEGGQNTISLTFGADSATTITKLIRRETT